MKVWLDLKNPTMALLHTLKSSSHENHSSNWENPLLVDVSPGRRVSFFNCGYSLCFFSECPVRRNSCSAFRFHSFSRWTFYPIWIQSKVRSVAHRPVSYSGDLLHACVL